MTQFKNGNIISLHLKNFQTFSNQEFHFQPSLNLIAAPNGSGKSSIANSIAFIFNGNQKTIGKSKQISEFIKFGESEATITANVAYESHTVKLMRVLVWPSKSSYYIDDKLVNQKEYLRFVEQLGVDVNNLCTFLPQERVSEFARMSGDELLVEMLKSSEIDMQELYDMQSGVDSVEKTLETKRAAEQMVRSNIAQLEDGVKSIKEREENEAKLQKLLFRRDYNEYLQLEASYKNNKQIVLQNSLKMEENRNIIEGVERQIAEIEGGEVFVKYLNSIKNLEEQNDRMKIVVNDIRKKGGEYEMKGVDLIGFVKKGRQKMEEVSKKEGELEKVEVLRCEIQKEIDSKVEEYRQNLISYHNNSNNSINDINNSINSINNSINSININRIDDYIPQTKFYTDQIQDCQSKTRQIAFKSSQIQQQIENLEQQKIDHSEQKNQRLEMLRKYHPDTHKGVLWLRENKGLFKNEVLEPAFLHIVIDKNYISEVECLLSFQALSSFLVHSSEDFSTLTRNLKDRMAINVAQIVINNNKDFISREEMNQWGVDGVASDFIDGRQEYKDFLINYGYINLIPISKKEVNESEIFKSHSFIRKMILAGRYAEIKRSKYNKDFIIVTNKISPLGIFTFPKFEMEGVNRKLGELAEIRKANKVQLDGILERQQSLESEVQEIKRVFDTSCIRKLVFTLKRNDDNIEFIRSDLHKLKNINYEGEIENIRKEQIELSEEIEREFVNLGGILGVENIPVFELEKMNDARLDYENQKRILLYHRHLFVLDEERMKVVLKEKEEAKNKIIELKQKLRLYMKCDNIKNDNIEPYNINNDNMKCDNMKDNIKPYNIKDDTEPYNNIKDIIKDDTEPYNIDIINEQIKILAAKIEISKKQTSLLDEYKSKEAILNSISTNIQSLTKTKQNLEGEFLEKKESFLRQIYAFLNPVNDRFSRMFKQFGFTGMLELDASVREWSLNIKVKFRLNENLQLLSSYRQSGGEKSLTTILFLLSLQQCQRTPFRLVDEINQGMDAYNERMVFEILKEMSSESQFFIITPKLVDDLVFSENTNTIVVYGNVTESIERYTKLFI